MEKDFLTLEETIGEIRLNNCGTPMMVVGGKNKKDCNIQFLDEFGYIKKHISYAVFRSGSVKNPYDRNTCGVGYVGVGKYKTSDSAFTVWNSMIVRCYDETARFQGKNQSYLNAFVCERWLNYQRFADWYYENIYTLDDGEKVCVDKDIKYKGNKEYAPNTCLMVPMVINGLFSVKKPKENGLPEGINLDKNGKYKVSYRGEVIAVVDSVEEGCILHDKAKKDYIVQLTNERYKGRIPDHVYKAIVNWIPDYLPDGFCRLDGINSWARNYDYK